MYVSEETIQKVASRDERSQINVPTIYRYDPQGQLVSVKPELPQPRPGRRRPKGPNSFPPPAPSAPPESEILFGNPYRRPHSKERKDTPWHPAP